MVRQGTLCKQTYFVSSWDKTAGYIEASRSLNMIHKVAFQVYQFKMTQYTVKKRSRKNHKLYEELLDKEGRKYKKKILH